VARIRTIKPEFFQDEKLSSMSMADRFIFLGLISMADDAGRLLDNVKVIEAFIFPTTDDRVHESLMNLAREGRIRRGITSSGQKVIQILGWSKHQYVQHPNLKAALPEIVEDTPLTTDAAVSHESFMNENSGPHESFRLRPTTYDLRSTTNDLKPAGREKRTKAPPKESAPARETWLSPCARAWERRFGVGTFSSKFGEAAKFLGPIHAGGATPSAIGIALGNYCDANKLNKFMSIKHFAQHYQRWSGPLWEDGWLTELGLLVTAPPSSSNVA